jgi:Icc-related predicted phosphoesterase
MMQTFQLASDLHLRSLDDLSDDFYQATSPTLVLVGDVCESKKLRRYLPVFERMSKTWETVLYVLGNHEFYDGVLTAIPSYYKDTLKQFSNIFVLDDETKKIGDITFIGSTLWSDMNKEDPLCMMTCRMQISDYYHIKIRDTSSLESFWRKITPADTIKIFKKSIKFLREQVKQHKDDKNLIVITHHAPSSQSSEPEYRGTLINGGFTSNLEDFVADSPIKAWVHGHCHNDCHYLINDCRVICHPLGYYSENYTSPNDYRPLTISIGEPDA